MDAKTSVLAVSGVMGTSVTYLFGDWDKTLTILMVVIAMNYVSGVVRAAYLGELSSKKSAEGIIRKFGLIMVVILANLADGILSDGSPLIRTFAVYFYIANEAISTLENLNKIDVLVPDFLKEKFDKMLDTVSKDKDIDKSE